MNMWSQVQKMLQPDSPAANKNVAADQRGPLALIDAIATGFSISFARSSPLPQLAGARATVIAIRQYRFGTDLLKSYQLQVGPSRHFFMTIGTDEQGHYLSLSRALNDTEQDRWFGRDALSFFTEPSTAKSIRCKIDLVLESAWAAARYSKSVDWVEGSVTNLDAGRGARNFHYNLLVDETGSKALEIEHDDASGENRVFITVYRPIEDILTIERAAPVAAPPIPQIPLEKMNGRAHEGEVPLFKEPALPLEAEIKQQPKQRPDFRRMPESVAAEEPEEIRIPRTPALSLEMAEEEDLPAFLLTREANYVSLDEVIPPEPERVRVGLRAAQKLIQRATKRNVRVRDVLRDMLGLESALSEEVIFEMPLSDADYRTLAMRYKLRPDHRVEIRARLEEELRRHLGD